MAYPPATRPSVRPVGIESEDRSNLHAAQERAVSDKTLGLIRDSGFGVRDSMVLGSADSAIWSKSTDGATNESCSSENVDTTSCFRGSCTRSANALRADSIRSESAGHPRSRRIAGE